MSYRVYFTTVSQPCFWEKKDFRTASARKEWIEKERGTLSQVEVKRSREPDEDKTDD